MKSARGAAFFLTLLLAGGSVGEAWALRKPRNPRWTKPKKPAAARPEAAALPPKIPEILAAGRWKPEVKRALEDFLRAKGKDSPGYNPRLPPAAVFVWDDAVIVNDLAEAVFARLVERVDFKFEDKFWLLVPRQYLRGGLRVDYEQFLDEPQSVWSQQASYQQYRKKFLQAYQDLCQRQGRKECRAWLVRLLWGFRVDELKTYAQDAVKDELERALTTEVVGDHAGDASPVEIRRGLRLMPEMADLIANLRKFGFDVWVVGEDGQEFLEAMIAQYGLDPARAIGIRAETADGKRTGEILEPAPIESGKASAVASALGRVPAFVVGADGGDAELLGYGSGTRLLLDKGNGALRAAAAEKGWLVQPAFARPAGGAAASVEELPGLAAPKKEPILP